MEIVAQVFNFCITQTELEFAERLLLSHFPEIGKQAIHKHALSRLIDDYLLMHEALENGIELDAEEYDEAFLQFLDEEMGILDSSHLVNRSDREEQIERIVCNKLINAKYIRSFFETEISESDVYKYYLESKSLFTKEPEVRASHILFKGDDRQAYIKAVEIRKQIHGYDDFINFCSTCSVCPSGSSCGDLGFFKRGIMLPEFDAIAFDMAINEISQPFKSCYGYHILMVTDKIEGFTVEFDSIKASLRDSLLNMKHNLTIKRLFTDIQLRYADKIKIF